MIPNEIIDRVLDKVDIVEIISAVLPLKKTGQNFKACCPFHEEKTPSFVVSAPKQIYHCFGCGAGGNAIGFLMKYEKMEFPEAIKVLSEKAGVQLPRSAEYSGPKNSLYEKLHQANETACSYYEKNLRSEQGKEAFAYLIGRGLTEKTIKEFRLGFSTDSWQGLVDHCKTGSIDTATLLKAGLVLQKTQTSNFYDRFRNRIMFPIFDQRGKIIGFGGRSLDSSLPKYMNSPETPVYTKGRNLYGLNFSKEQMRRQSYVIIVEGYFDLILPYQNQLKNVVATLGTALTPEQISAIKRFTKNVIMIYDADKAGEAATLRGLDLLISEDMNVRIALLPKGLDPDSFVRKEGREKGLRILRERRGCWSMSEVSPDRRK